MGDFRWWVPRWLRNWYMTKDRKHATSERLYVVSPTAWVISQSQGRRWVHRGYTPLYGPDHKIGRVTIEGRGGWTYYGDGSVKFDDD